MTLTPNIGRRAADRRDSMREGAQAPMGAARPGCQRVRAAVRGHGRSSAVEAGHRAQQEFEHFRRTHLLNASVGRPSNCDETVGRFCYWYNEKAMMLAEPRTVIGAARDRPLAELDSLNKAFSRRSLDHRPARALSRRSGPLSGSTRGGAAAAESGGGGADIRRRLRAARARRLRRRRLGRSTTRRSGRCSRVINARGTDVSLLLDDDARQQYRRYECGDPQKHRIRGSRLASRTHVRLRCRATICATRMVIARTMMAQMLKDAPSQYQFGFDDDERELMLRFGWERSVKRI